MVRKPVRFFVSYARADETACTRLLDRLRIQMAPSAKYDFQLWDDRAILTGELWEQEILRASDESDLGLLLVSPAFLGADFISENELPKYVGSESKPAIPVEVQAVNVTRHDLKGLQHQQLFRLDRQTPFGMCTGNNQSRFAEQLYDQIEHRLQRLGI